MNKYERDSIAGHSNNNMDYRYNRIDDQDKHEAIKKLQTFR